MKLKVIRTGVLLFSIFVAYLAYATLYSHAIIRDNQTGKIIFGYDHAAGKFYLNEYPVALKSLDRPYVFYKLKLKLNCIVMRQSCFIIVRDCCGTLINVPIKNNDSRSKKKSSIH